MSDRDEVIHRLNDNLNGIAISVELAIRLLEVHPDAREARDILRRVEDDCRDCAELIAELR